MVRRIITAGLTLGAAAIVLTACKPQTPAPGIKADADLELEGNINSGGASGDGAMIKKKDDAMMEKKEDGTMMKKKDGDAAMMKKEESAKAAAIDAELKAMGDVGSDAELNEMEKELNAE